MKTCECGCELPTTVYQGKPRRFISGHHIRGEKNHQWKGDKVSCKVLHKWVRRNYLPPDKCQICDKVGPVDLVNVTGVYNRDFYNWAYDCEHCHKIIDRTKYMRDRKCSVCGSNKTYINKNRKANRISGRPVWCYSKLTGELQCKNCNQNEYRRLR